MQRVRCGCLRACRATTLKQLDAVKTLAAASRPASFGRSRGDRADCGHRGQLFFHVGALRQGALCAGTCVVGELPQCGVLSVGQVGGSPIKTLGQRVERLPVAVALRL